MQEIPSAGNHDDHPPTCHAYRPEYADVRALHKTGRVSPTLRGLVQTDPPGDMGPKVSYLGRETMGVGLTAGPRSRASSTTVQRGRHRPTLNQRLHPGFGTELVSTGPGPSASTSDPQAVAWPMRAQFGLTARRLGLPTKPDQTSARYLGTEEIQRDFQCCAQRNNRCRCPNRSGTGCSGALKKAAEANRPFGPKYPSAQPGTGSDPGADRSGLRTDNRWPGWLPQPTSKPNTTVSHGKANHRAQTMESSLRRKMNSVERMTYWKPIPASGSRRLTSAGVLTNDFCQHYGTHQCPTPQCSTFSGGRRSAHGQVMTAPLRTDLAPTATAALGPSHPVYTKPCQTLRSRQKS